MIISGDLSIFSEFPFSLASHGLSLSKEKRAFLCVVQVQLILTETQRRAVRNCLWSTSLTGGERSPRWLSCCQTLALCKS